jgi:hypothetical protein
MKKLPTKIPKQWVNNLRSLTVPGLKHVRKNAFYNSSTIGITIAQIDLPSLESTGYDAFRYTLLASVKFNDTLKFIGSWSFWHAYIRLARVPSFTHFLSGHSFDTNVLLSYMSLSDLATMGDGMSSGSPAETFNVTCYSRISNIKKMLTRMSQSNGIYNMKNITIAFDDSIKHIVNTKYINTILSAKNNPFYGNWDYFFYNIRLTCNMVSLDLSNLIMSNSEIKAINVTDSSIPWDILFPHITTVDSGFSNLFKKLKGVVLFDTEAVAKGAFAGCQDITKVLGFCDTATFEAESLSNLAPSELQIKVTQPENIMSFLSDLQNAGLTFPNISKLIIKFSDSMAKSASVGDYVSNLLAALPPPPENSQNSGLFGPNCIIYFDLRNSNFTNIYDLPINELSREYSCVFTSPDGYHHFLQANNKIELNLSIIAEKNLIKTAILSKNLEKIHDNEYPYNKTFYGTLLTSITIPDTMTTIGDYAFSYTQITSVDLPNTVTTIGSYAFFNTPLTSVTIPNSVETIGSSAFSSTQLTSVTIPDSVITLAGFDGTKITSIEIPNSVETIGSAAFSNTLLTSVIIPDSVKTIESSAFANTQLTSITIPDSVITLAGFNSTKITSIEIPNSVKTIGQSAFSNTPLTSVTLSNSLETIASYAFQSTQFTSVTIPDSVTTIGDRAFFQAPITSLTIPDTANNIHANAFSSLIPRYVCPIQSVTINCCNTLSNNITAELAQIFSNYRSETINDFRKSIQTLKVALSSSIATKPEEDLKTYIEEILNNSALASNTIVTAILSKPSGLFELDLSNASTITQSDINSMTKTLPWTVKFATGGSAHYTLP